MEISYFPFITPPTFDLHFIQKMGNPHKELPIYFANYYIHSNVFIVGNSSTGLSCPFKSLQMLIYCCF